MAKIVELAYKDFKRTIINMFRDLKENMKMMKREIQNLKMNQSIKFSRTEKYNTLGKIH